MLPVYAANILSMEMLLTKDLSDDKHFQVLLRILQEGKRVMNDRGGLF